MARAPKKKRTFHQELVLNRWMLSHFHGDGLMTLKSRLGEDRHEGIDDDGQTKFFHELTRSLFDMDRINQADLQRYDLNIVGHWQKITHRRNAATGEVLTMKYIQYLSLLFTEIYLDWYFNHRQDLLDGLNQQMAAYRAEDGAEPFKDYTAEDLNKLAFWNATGSGKTLILHINILQYLHYFQAGNLRSKAHRLAAVEVALLHHRARLPGFGGWCPLQRGARWPCRWSHSKREWRHWAQLEIRRVKDMAVVVVVGIRGTTRKPHAKAIECRIDPRARKFIRRETKRRQVNLRRLDARQSIMQQRLVPGGVLSDAIIGKAQRFLLRGCEMLQDDHRHLGDAERFRRRQAAMARDEHAILVHQQRVGEAEGLHAGHDLRELRRVVHARIAGMRAQRGNRAELDPLGHPGKRHGGYPGRVGRGLGAN